jgi:hypothetical protein
MKTFFEARAAMVMGAVVVANAGAAPPSQTLLYRANVTTNTGQQQSVTASVTIAPEADGSMRITVTATDAPVVTVTIPSGATMPAPQGTPSAQRAQGTLILQRIALFGAIRRAMPVRSLGVRIPVLPPGASQPLALPAQLMQSGGSALTGSASTSTMATIDPTKAKIKGILPARRIAERVKNALTPSHVTLPDKITATIRAPLANGSVAKLSGQVVHVLTAHGQTTTATETWSLKPSH